MSEAYKCDGCGEFFEGNPLFKLEKSYLTYDEPRDGWTFHQIGCVILWANRFQEK